MLNQAVFVGRLAKDPELKELENGKLVSNITIAVERGYKNENGEYETDYIDCNLWDAIAKNTVEYCKKGDTVGIKGRVQTRMVEQDGKKRKVQEVVVERISFLSYSKTKNTEEITDIEM